MRRRWLATLVQPTITVRQTAPRGGHNISLTGVPAAIFLIAVFTAVLVFTVRFILLRRQARLAKSRGARAEAALARSESRYQQLFDHSPCPMCVYDSATMSIVEINDAAVAQYGYSREEFASMKLSDLVASGESPNATAEAPADGTHSDRFVGNVQPHRTKRGEIIDVEAQERPLALADGDTRLVVLMDVTAQRAAARSARDAGARARATSETLQSLFDVAPQAIVVVDADWRVTQWNNAAETLFGWTAAEVVGQPSPFVSNALTADARAQAMNAETSAFGGPVEITRTRKNGTQVDVIVASAPVLGANGERAGIISVFTDLTERKLLEEQLRQSQKMEAIGTLAGGIAHDFNNILTVITSYSSLLLADARSDDDRASLEEIANAAKRASELTRQLLTFSRKAVVRLRAVNLNEIVLGMRSILRRLLNANIEVVTTLASGLGFVVADPGQVEQIIMNLAVNAADAMLDGGTLVIETRDVELDEAYTRMHAGVKPGMYVMLAVSDTGTGMDVETTRKAFEPFFTTKEVGRGTGLGLATVYAIVSQLGGHVWAYSELGQGTTFKIYLPRDGSRRSTPAHAPIVAPKRASGTVLLVEDDEPVRRAVRRMLERHGLAVVEAADGQEALGVATSYEGTLNAVVTDLMMPKMNGRTFAAELEKVRPGLPVVFTSGYTDDAVVRRGLIGEQHTFLQKPFTGDQLATAIESVIAAGRQR